MLDMLALRAIGLRRIEGALKGSAQDGGNGPAFAVGLEPGGELVRLTPLEGLAVKGPAFLSRRDDRYRPVAGDNFE